MLVAALVAGLVIFLPQIISQIPKNGPTGPGNTPGISVTSSSGQTPSVDVSGAVSTIDNFCFLLGANGLEMAYRMTSQNYQNQHSIDAFRNQFGSVTAGGCLAGSATAVNNTVVVPLTITFQNGFQSSTLNYTATLDENPQGNGWEVANIVQQ
jgi:hypothetical protein